MTHWDFQNKGKLGWAGKSSFVLEVPLRYLRPNVIYSVPCDRILQRAYSVTLQYCIAHTVHTAHDFRVITRAHERVYLHTPDVAW